MAARYRGMARDARLVGRRWLGGFVVGLSSAVACVGASGSPALAAAPAPGVAGKWAVLVTGLIEPITSDTYTFVRRGKSDTYDVTNESAFRAVASIPPAGGSVTLDFWGGKTLGTGDHFAEHLKFNLASCPHRFTGTYSETFSDGTPGYHGTLKGHRGGACRKTKPDGLDWRMPPRLDEQPATWRHPDGLVAHRFLYPGKWHVDLFLTRRGNPLSSCPSNAEWRWTVEPPPGAKVEEKPRNGCQTKMEVSDLGAYQVTAAEYKRKRGKWEATGKRVHHRAVVKDWLLVGLGDSNGSGEGNPPFQFHRCDRGVDSYQFQVAEYVEKHDPRSSVTFVFSACSGATVEDLYKTHYAGTHPESPPLDPQIDQIAFDIKHHPGDPPARERHVDAAIVSIGINNLGFGPLLEFCIKNDLVTPRIPCQDERVTDVRDSRGAVTAFKGTFSSRAHTLEHELDTLQLDLPAAYAPLAHALSTPLGDSSLGVRPSHVAITQYPDFSRGTDGQLCSGTIGPQSTWQFMELEAGRLNRNVSAAAHAHGWKPVSLDQRVFTGPPGHGYCASPSYFVSLGTAVFGHGNIPSGFHPTLQGHFITAQATRRPICEALYGNPGCDGEPR